MLYLYIYLVLVLQVSWTLISSPNERFTSGRGQPRLWLVNISETMFHPPRNRNGIPICHKHHLCYLRRAVPGLRSDDVVVTGSGSGSQSDLDCWIVCWR